MDQDCTWHGGGPWSRPHCARWGLSSPPQKRGRSPQFSTHFCCGQTVGCIKMPLRMEVNLCPGHIVLDGDPAPLPKKATQPPLQFLAHFYCGQMAGRIKITLSAEVGLSPGHIVLDGHPAPPKKGHSPPHFSDHGYCDQTAAWMKVPLGTKVDLGLDNIVLDADSAPPSPKGHSTPSFRPMSIVAMVAHLSCC